MPLGLTIHGKWDGISMASPQLHPYKHERPAYSTPQPVENTPANNECRMVDLRGAKVASFIVAGEEFICLPQAFDLFLKHLVGGLHTVYTKLKRLSITPVVCNVEQVRILRGLGAIQPGVNRCKLITRKDFEILYQDCTQASRPGRPPKRYPMLPPSTDLMSHHGMRSMTSSHSMLSPTDFNNLHKRMRLEQDADKHLHLERRMSSSPTKDSPFSSKDLTVPQTNELHSNAANLYLQAQQALRQQYQHASGLQNGMDAQHVAAAAGINPALAPLMMMSHPGLFSGALPPSSMNMLNHINQFVQSHGTMHQQAAAQAAAQVAAAAQSAAHASLAAAASARSSSRDGNKRNEMDEKDSDCEEVHTPSQNSLNQMRAIAMSNDHENCSSPQSSVNSDLAENFSEGSVSMQSEGGDSNKDVEELNDSTQGVGLDREGEASLHDHVNVDEKEVNDVMENMTTENLVTQEDDQSLTAPNNLSSMQTLLTNIQGLLKVAADNARLQEKQCTFEIADLKTKVSKERQIRGTIEKKLQESERLRGIIQKRLKRERKVRKILQEKILVTQRQLGQESGLALSKLTNSPINLASGIMKGTPDIPRKSPAESALATGSGSPLQPSSPGSVPASSPISVSKATSITSTAFTKIASVMSPINATPFVHTRMIGTHASNGTDGSSSPTNTNETREMSPNAFPNSRGSSLAEQDINLDFSMTGQKIVERQAIQENERPFLHTSYAASFPSTETCAGSNNRRNFELTV